MASLSVAKHVTQLAFGRTKFGRQTRLDELDSCVGADNVERLLSNSLAGSSRCRIGRFLTREANSMIRRS
jgi:hypothetical protein